MRTDDSCSGHLRVAFATSAMRNMVGRRRTFRPDAMKLVQLLSAGLRYVDVWQLHLEMSKWRRQMLLIRSRVLTHKRLIPKFREGSNRSSAHQNGGSTPAEREFHEAAVQFTLKRDEGVANKMKGLLASSTEFRPLEECPQTVRVSAAIPKISGRWSFRREQSPDGMILHVFPPRERRCAPRALTRTPITRAVSHTLGSILGLRLLLPRSSSSVPRREVLSRAEPLSDTDEVK